MRRPQYRRRSAQGFDYGQEIVWSPGERGLGVAMMIAGGLAGGMVLGSLLIAWPRLSSTFAPTTSSPQLAVCGMVKRNCVVDGDTFHFEGQGIRVADIDKSELRSRRDYKYQKSREARDRLVLLLNEGPFEVRSIGDRDQDQYGRKLRGITRDGSSLGDRFVSEGLARTWTGRREPW